MKKLISLLLCLALLAVPASAAAAATGGGIDIEAPSGILMHASGRILYEKDAQKPMEPASVTKVMTLLLIFEALGNGVIKLGDTVTASRRAASMGGSQIWLEEGEQLTVDEMIKCIVIVSANDCCVAMAEHLAGAEEAFVERMNQRARELGAQNTQFQDCTGLTGGNHLTTALDLALVSNALIAYPDIQKYTLTWQDSIRGGESVLNNSNRLVRTFDGITGLKTGWTRSSGYCISATASRGGLDLVAVVMKGESIESRNADAVKLLSYGFANFASVSLTPDTPIMPAEVLLGKQKLVACDLSDKQPQIYEKSKLHQVEKEIVMGGPLTAPVEAGRPVGEMVVRAGGEIIARVPIVTQAAVERQGVWNIFADMLRAVTMRRG